jgi:hypothetical protein
MVFKVVNKIFLKKKNAVYNNIGIFLERKNENLLNLKQGFKK